MKKILFVCAMAACVVACAEQRCNDCAMGYEYVPAYTCGCNACETVTTTCNTCPTLQPVFHQQPKTVVVVLPPAPQPVVEEEIIYAPQPKCGCNKCGCQKKKSE